MAQSDLPVALDSVDANSHRGVGVRAAHKRAAKPKGRGGQATWYKPGLGNCGGYNKESDMILALPMSVYSGGKYCGKMVKITNPSNGKTCTAKVADSCPGCGPRDLDVSPRVFEKISKSLDDGVATINWDVRSV
ncbi:rare lipoprotein A-like double-psi beta-barrel protein [Rhizoctonia solani AG-3 Rhs1AP]|uniref:Rare lipoprotein A-like double-psi beta-barrel protein n=2 Tax=Rhizoctonia solani AG-3 TaxID=1086053 RepID=A0A074SND7_9AGAM|nr:rare lipoprotein A-like double-psi beta-barrel protein [Rhizoctonia solani AG-3 Rhs1AP]KEP51567.1 rare lipoprotein A-like double-psi beta-barrel protein [Rhizoctonia solani 123E]